MYFVVDGVVAFLEQVGEPISTRLFYRYQLISQPLNRLSFAKPSYSSYSSQDTRHISIE